ncbi:amino acid aminotransferase [Sphingopyxis panaciterrae]
MSDVLEASLPFDLLAPQPADALLGLITLYRADSRLDKIDLGVGVFRDDDGQTPIMRAVKAAEAALFEVQTTKSYLGAEGDALYTELLAEIVFGDQASSERMSGVQTPGGTGALRLGAELLARANPDAKVWLGSPTWPNHAPIFAEAGLKTRNHRFYDHASAGVDFTGMLDDLRDARAGDVILLHGCCHNPTGASFSPDQWAALSNLCETRGLIPFIDLAYQGLGDGLAEDALATRTIFAQLPSAILAYSCDKNFGLYRERVGALWVQSGNRAIADRVRMNMLSLARSLWSMPPDHGAAVVRTILEDAALRADWVSELGSMRERLNGLRRLVAAAHPRLSPIGVQRGMFAMLPIAPAVVAALREDHGIYMAGNGRINIAGLRAETVPIFTQALMPHID